MTEQTDPFPQNSDPILEAVNLCKYFTVYVRGKKATLKAVDNVNLKIYPGRTLGLVGESGSGKSTIAFTMVHYHQPTSGKIIHYDKGSRIHIEGMRVRTFRQRLQMVFQDPYSSLDPRQTLKTIIERPLKLHTRLNHRKRLEAIIGILHQVGLDAGQLYRYPHEFSGGQRQRIAIARALAVNPRVIICDEPVSALDVSVQAQILNLLKRLQEEQGLAYLFVSHDLNVVRHISHEVAVIYMGRVAERARGESLFDNPRHPYSRALMASMPGLERRDAGVELIGEISSPIDPPPGCRLASRCPVAMDRCKSVDPELKEIAPGHYAACLRY
jgi:oligopeptide/dipeptide ABC transporter ATP-binding protein